MVETPPVPASSPNGASTSGYGGRASSTSEYAGGGAQPIFTSYELEQLSYRRFNPLQLLTAAFLTQALDEFDAGNLTSAARLWDKIIRRNETLPNVKAKREESVALRAWSVVPNDDTPAAADQASALTNFYQNLRASHATKRHVTGGFSLLAQQMMDSVAFEYAVHHIVWQPDASRQVKLPSGATVPFLGAMFEFVPLEFFEARTGVLRFLGLWKVFVGDELEPMNWLVTTGPGLMMSAAIVAYYERLAMHDLINFSEKFGTPGIAVHTTAAKDSAEGQAALAFARSLGSNYRGVIYGAAENKVEIIWPQGGATGKELPMHIIRDDSKRELASLWLGADLSTLSRGGSERGIGASLQGDEREKRERHDCARLSETLQATIDPIVIRWYFGQEAPILAKLVIESPINEDRALLANVVQLAVSLGAKVPIEPTCKRLGVPIAKEKEEVFTAPKILDQPTPDRPGGAFNVVDPSGDPDLETFLGPLRAEFLKAFANDLQPLRSAISAVLATDLPEISADRKLLWLNSQLPALAKEILAAPKAAGPLTEILRKSVEQGFTQAQKERQLT